MKVGLAPELMSRVLGTAFGVATLGTVAWLSRRAARRRLVAGGTRCPRCSSPACPAMPAGRRAASRRRCSPSGHARRRLAPRGAARRAAAARAHRRRFRARRADAPRRAAAVRAHRAAPRAGHGGAPPRHRRARRAALARRLLAPGGAAPACGGAGTTAGGCPTPSTSSRPGSAGRGSRAATTWRASSSSSICGSFRWSLRPGSSSNGRAACACSSATPSWSAACSPSTWRRSAATSWACSASSCRSSRWSRSSPRSVCARRWRRSAQRRPAAAAAVIVVALVLHALARGAGRPARARRSWPVGPRHRPSGWLRWYTDDRAAIGRWFARYARPDDYAAVGGAGAQVYYSGMRSLDCYGLSDEYIAHQVAASSSRPGHQKYAPDDYILLAPSDDHHLAQLQHRQRALRRS